PLVGESVEVVARLRDDAGSVEADRGQLEQVLTNLVVNARDAMPGGGVLTLETAPAEVPPAPPGAPDLPPGRYVTVSVADTGTGMDEATLARLFEPFFTTEREGTGLGLWSAYGIVQRSGGHIAIASAP